VLLPCTGLRAKELLFTFGKYHKKSAKGKRNNLTGHAKKNSINLALRLHSICSLNPSGFWYRQRVARMQWGRGVWVLFPCLIFFPFRIILDLGITNFNNRNMRQNAQLLQKHFSGILSIRLVFGSGLPVGHLGTGWLVDTTNCRWACWPFWI
jgi:hypothetical protein